jgi:hypothetical protein
MERHMPIEKLTAPAPIRIEIDASFTLLQALDKTLPGAAALSSDERFEIAALKFTVARALCLNKRARAS